jgi:hypothetical protein
VKCLACTANDTPGLCTPADPFLAAITEVETQGLEKVVASLCPSHVRQLESYRKVFVELSKRAPS